MPRATLSLLVYVSLHIVPGVLGDEMEVVVHPENRNVSLNEDASFNCEIKNADILIWLLNNVAIQEEEHSCVKDFQTTRKVGKTLVGNLTLPITGCSDKLNNTHVKCQGVSVSAPPFVVFSSSAKLKLQGLVGSPEGMNATFSDADHLEIYWDRPYTLDGIRIIEYNVTHRSNSSFLGNGSNTTTETNYSLDTPTTNQDYNVVVCATAKTEAGFGEQACAPKQTVRAVAAKQSDGIATESTIADSHDSGLATSNLLLMTLSLSIGTAFVL